MIENNENQKLIEENEKLKKIIRHLVPEKSGYFFICGEMGSKDEFNMPDTILVCPGYGADGWYRYKRDSEYTAPGW
jgi:hypothetical protein